MLKQNARLLLLIGIQVLLLACAQQVAPTGGHRDETPPRVLSCAPENKSLNFESERVLIRFDEYVQIKDPSKIFVSPLPSEKPDISSLGKVVEIRFRQGSLKHNTTYTVNFGNTLTDVHESNVLQNFSYVFSTGSVLDTNRISGKLLQCETMSPQKDLVVGLFPVSARTDTLFKNQQPLYFALSTENGAFAINNLPSDSFFLLAFRDANGDFKYQYTEDCAFPDQPTNTSSFSDSLIVYVFSSPTHPEKSLLDTFCRERGLFQFVFYKPGVIRLDPIGGGVSYQRWKKGLRGFDTLQVILPKTRDSLQPFQLQTRDSIFSFTMRHKPRLKTPVFSLQLQIPEKSGDTLFVVGSLPIDSLVPELLSVKQDTLPMKGVWVRYTDAAFYFKPSFLSKQNYSIQISDSAFYSCYHQWNKPLQASFNPKDLTEYGNLLLHFKFNQQPGLVMQLMDVGTEPKVIREFKGVVNPTEWEIKNLIPGNYRFRVFLDSNKNGEWDTGNLRLWKQPERVIYFPLEILVKAYWDIEQTIDLDMLIKSQP